ncbi:unnamed protein product [Paramecium primaurelia]|uniref:USP domain-containing protein n=1 Tax=Paramecium primaurelia TaxID=5886 RepID=A0A8S1L8L2_PARPR|nr:unnamed protein product [Paramecium primaurelia]
MKNQFSYGSKYNSQIQQTPFGNSQIIKTNNQQSKSRLPIFDDYKIQQPQSFSQFNNFSIKQLQTQQKIDQTQQQSYNIVQLPKGLNNIGNNCFMNAIIQMLYSIKQFRKAILDLPVKQLQTDSISFHLQSLFQELNFSKIQYSINPTQFYHEILKKHNQFQFGRQEDAHEFLLCLFQTLGSECKNQQNEQSFFDDIKNFFEDIFLGNNRDLEQKIEKEWKQKRQLENNIITNLFVGLFSNKIICKNCQFEQIHYEEFNVLALSLEYYLESCLLNELIKFQFKPQIITNYKCQKCQQDEHQLIQKIAKLPKILIIQLKRFNYLNSAQRINTNIIFPLDNLSLIEQCTPNIRSCSYDLQTIIHHSGTCNNGHYYATCKYIENNSIKWFRFDDSIVEEAQLEKRQYDTYGTPTPYMLIFEQKQYAQ